MDTEGNPKLALPDQEFLTVKQTAKYLNISASIVYRLCITKKLGHYRFGEGAGAIRINRTDLTEFMQRCHIEERDGADHVDVTLHRRSQQGIRVYKHLDLRDEHPCGAMTKAGTPCTLMTRDERCHLHRKTTGTTA